MNAIKFIVSWLGVFFFFFAGEAKGSMKSRDWGARCSKEQQEKLIPKHLLVCIVCLDVLGRCPSVCVSVCLSVWEIAHAYANMSQLSFQL